MVNSRLRTGRGQVRGNFLTAAWTQAWPSCGISRTLRKIARLLRGRCAETVWRLTRHVPTVARRLPRHCPAIARMFHRLSRGRCAGNHTGWCADGARMVRGWCAAIRRIFCEHRRLKNLRGEASTLKPAQNCVGTSVGIHLRNYQQHVDWHGSLQVNGTAQNI